MAAMDMDAISRNMNVCIKPYENVDSHLTNSSQTEACNVASSRVSWLSKSSIVPEGPRSMRLASPYKQIYVYQAVKIFEVPHGKVTPLNPDAIDNVTG